MKGITIPRKQKSLQMLGSHIDRFIMDGTEVWLALSRVRTFLSSGSFTVPAGTTTVRLCGSGGGGGGSSSNLHGGDAGEIISHVDLPVTPGDEIEITIGQGGQPDLPGEATLFGSLITLQGGTAGTHEGDGEERATCGGTHTDGLLVNTYYGGQASPFSNGGDGEDGAGEFGSGGGAGVTGGIGGNGRLTVRWSEG